MQLGLLPELGQNDEKLKFENFEIEKDAALRRRTWQSRQRNVVESQTGKPNGEGISLVRRRTSKRTKEGTQCKRRYHKGENPGARALVIAAEG
jgi:hypothetical protein